MRRVTNAATLRRSAVIAAENYASTTRSPMKTMSRDSRFAPEHARNSGACRTTYFDDDDGARYEAVDVHAATEGIVVSVAIGILLWAFIGLGFGWL